MTNSAKWHTIYVRLPVNTWTELAETAKAEHRSVSAQALHYLESGLSEGRDDDNEAAAKGKPVARSAGR
jgi:hypothetical protein